MLNGIDKMLRMMTLQTLDPTHKTPFLGEREPCIDFYEYLVRLYKLFECSSSCFVVALVYICRVAAGQPPRLAGIPVHPWSCHRLFLVGLMVAVKQYEDELRPNTHYAKVGGLKKEELERLEWVFAKQLNWRFSVSIEEYEIYSRLIRGAGGGS